ncbi:MAG: hypothetical protein ABIP97_04740 [Chthoniobacterales bacterium]
MKRTTILSAILGLSLITTLQPLRAADPQQPPDHGKGAHCDRGKGGPGKGGHQHPFQDLNLTDDQKKQVKAIMEEDKPKFEALRKEQIAKIRTILTPEQQKVLDDKQTRHEDKQALKKK